jgi:hypothetical protein
MQSRNAVNPQTVAQLTSEFYMAVPHAFPRSQKPPIIDSLELLQEKFEMVRTRMYPARAQFTWLDPICVF